MYKIAGGILLALAGLLPLPYLLYGLLWLCTGLPPKTAEQLERARRIPATPHLGTPSERRKILAAA
jgi:hypothetical protein